MYAVDIWYATSHFSEMDETNSERVITPMPPSLVRAIDDYRFSRRVPSRAEAIRRLIERGLTAEQQQPSADPPIPERST